MKIRPLHDIDLARIAPLPGDQQRRQLMQIRDGRPPFSYKPLRSCLHDILNIQPEMFGPVVATEWVKIEAHLKKECRSEDEAQANLFVARGLYGLAKDLKIIGRDHEFFPLAMNTGHRVTYWLPMILSVGGRAVVPFIEPRRSRGLGPEGRRFAFSMMNERIRVADPDFSDVQLVIYRFGEVDQGIRSPKPYTDDRVDLFSFDEMENMVNTTYNIWREVCEERESEARKKAAGMKGALI